MRTISKSGRNHNIKVLPDGTHLINLKNDVVQPSNALEANTDNKPMKSRAGSNLRPSAGLKITASPEKMRLQHGAGARSSSLKKRTNLNNYLKDKDK